MRAMPAMSVALALSIGCHSPTVPTSAWRRGMTPVDGATPHPQPRQPAVLEIRNASAIVHREGWDSYHFWYAVYFDLVETAGESGAFIQGIRLSIGDEFDELVDIDCFGPVRVGAGNSFRVDEGVEYCAPYAASHTEVDGIDLEVSFVDDYLRAGRVRIVVPVRK